MLNSLEQIQIYSELFQCFIFALSFHIRRQPITFISRFETGYSRVYRVMAVGVAFDVFDPSSEVGHAFWVFSQKPLCLLSCINSRRMLHRLARF